MAEVHTYQLGDIVSWTSQSNGITREKTGTIVAVVPARQTLQSVMRGRADLNDQRQYNNHDVKFGGMREHVSYLVAVSMQTPQGKPRQRQKLYWPLVAKLAPCR